MYAVMGFAVGYVVGCKQGQEGFEKLMSSINHIRKSDEFAAAVETGRALLGQTLQQAFTMGKGVVGGEAKNVTRRLRAA